MAKRRAKGEGSLHQRHDHPTCPPKDEAGERPGHRCRGRWVGVVDLGWSGGKRRRKTVYAPTEALARARMKRAKAATEAGVTATASQTVESWMRHWLEEVCEPKLKVNTMKSHRSKVERHIIPRLGRHKLDALAPEHVRDAYAEMRRDGLAESTIRQTHAILRRALTVAHRERKVPYNVALMLDAPSTKQAKRLPLTTEEAWRVLATNELRWWVALYLGLRQGEALALRWSDVDLESRSLTVHRTLVRKPGVGLVYDTPKSDASNRTIPLPAKTAARFKLQATEVPHEPDDLVFPSAKGGPLDHRRDWQNWQDVLAAVGVKPYPLHSARHTAASVLEAEGVPDRMVAQILGQGSVTVTHGYQTAEFERLRDALDRGEAAITRHDVERRPGVALGSGDD